MSANDLWQVRHEESTSLIYAENKNKGITEAFHSWTQLEQWIWNNFKIESFDAPRTKEEVESALVEINIMLRDE